MEVVVNELLNCQRCSLCKTRKNVVPGTGNPEAKVILLGEAPGQEEDIQGKPFVGSAGRLLDKVLAEAGLNRNDFWIDNIVHCVTPMTLIECKNCVKFAKHIKVNDIVKTHTGNFQKVTHVFKRHISEDIYCIKPYFNTWINITKEHPFLTKRGWVVAKDLKESDWLFYPKTLQNTQISNLKFLQTLIRTSISRKKLPSFIENCSDKIIDSFLQRYFLGEGSVYKNQKTLSTTSLALSFQLRSLLINRNYVPNLSEYCYQYKNQTKIIYNLCYTFKKEDTKRYIQTNKGCWFKIEKIFKRKYTGFVYNYEVEKDNTYIANGIVVHNCRPVAPPGSGKENRTPTSEEVEACASYFEDIIKQMKPKLIVGLGNIPLKYLLEDRTINISKKRGQFFWSDKYQCYITGVFHPAAILRRYEWYTTAVNDLVRIKEFLTIGDVPKKVPVKYTLITRPKDLDIFLQDLANQKEFAFDIESTDLNFVTEKIICVGFSWKEYEGFTVPFLTEKGESFWDETTFNMMIERLNKIFQSSVVKIGHNLKFDCLFLRKYGIRISLPVFDTMLAHYLIDENAKGMRGLKELAWTYTDMGGYERGLEEYQKTNKLGKHMLGIPYDIMLQYNAGDADCTFRLYNKFKYMLEEDQKLSKLFYVLTMPLVLVLLETEFRGVKIDVTYLKQLEQKFDKQLEKIKQEIFTKIGKEINLNSPRQLQQLLFKDLNLKSKKRTKTGESTDEEVLQTLASQHEIPKLLLDYRKVQKLQSTYVKGLEYDDKYRVHTDYSLATTTTGRLASSNPNLQNIPHESELKDIFTADDGYMLCEMDFSQAEFRCWGHYSQDQKMINDLKQGLDIHRLVASRVFNIPFEKVDKESRRIAKMVVFGLMYGRGAASVAEEHKMSIKQAYKIINEFFSLYPVAKRWIDFIVVKAKTEGELVNFFGRKRRFPMFNSPNEEVRAHAENQAKNYLMQSTASDITCWTSVRLFDILKPYDTYLVLNVHDCLVYETPEQHIDTVAKIIKREAERSIKGFLVPMVVEIKVGKKWGSLQPYV